MLGQCESPSHDEVVYFTGVWIAGTDTSIVDGREIIRVGDIGVTDCGHVFVAATGADASTDAERPLHRVGDIVLLDEGGIGITMTGSGPAASF